MAGSYKFNAVAFHPHPPLTRCCFPWGWCTTSQDIGHYTTIRTSEQKSKLGWAALLS